MVVESLFRTPRWTSLRARTGIGGGVVVFLLHVLVFAGVAFETSDPAMVFDPYTNLLQVDGGNPFLLVTLVPGEVGGGLAAMLFHLWCTSVSARLPRLRILVFLVGTVWSLLIGGVLLAMLALYILMVVYMGVSGGIAGTFSGIFWGALSTAVYGIIVAVVLGNLLAVSTVSIGIGWISGELIWKAVSALRTP